MVARIKALWQADGHHQRRLYPHDRRAPRGRQCRRYSRSCMTRATSTKANTKGWYCTPCEAVLDGPHRPADGKCPGLRARGARGRRRRAISSGHPNMRIRLDPSIIEDHRRVYPAGEPARRKCLTTFLLAGAGRPVRVPHVLQVGHPGSRLTKDHVIYVWI